MAGELGQFQLPEWVDLKRWDSYQYAVFQEVCERFEDGNDLVILSAPTGLGKSLIAEMVRQHLAAETSSYICTTKTLQDQFCLAPSTKVLRGDLRWVSLGDLTIGDPLLAFDEERVGKRRHWRQSYVESIETHSLPSYRLIFEDGTEIISSADHRWLVGAGQVHKWLTTEQLRVDESRFCSAVIRLLDPWTEDTSWEAGYLAAAFDGEGHLGQRPPAHHNGWDVNLVFSQNENPMLNLVRELLHKNDFRFTENQAADCRRLFISHRKDQLRFLGQIRPERLLNKLDLNKLGMMNPVQPCKVVAKEFLGNREVLGMGTSTGTFVAEGLASHNCRSFPYAKLIKGRANYIPLDVTPGPWDITPSCAECDLENKECSYCTEPHNCPYTVAKREALSAELACTNTAYFIGECSSPKSQFSGRDFVILDEADLAEGEVMSQVSVEVSPRMQDYLNLRLPKFKTEEAKHGRASWEEWFDYAIPFVAAHKLGIRGKSLRERRRRATLDRLVARLTQVRANLDDYVYTGYEKGAIEFKPVRVNKIANDALMKHGKRWLHMSASIVPQQQVNDLGYEGQWGEVFAPSVFPVERRPVYFCPSARMISKLEQTERPKMVPAVRAVIRRHPDKRILVHTHSYALTRVLMEGLVDEERPIFSYLQSKEREGAIAKYESTEGAVLLASSLDRGYDGKDDLVGVVVIAKVPAPYLGDKQINTRLFKTDGGDEWYSTQTAYSLIQMVGRGMRHEEDECIVYVLDSQFAKFFGRWAGRNGSDRHRLFPPWFTEALDMNSDVRFELRQEVRELLQNDGAKV